MFRPALALAPALRRSIEMRAVGGDFALRFTKQLKIINHQKQFAGFKFHGKLFFNRGIAYGQLADF